MKRADQTIDQESRSDSLTASKVLATASSATLAWKVVVIFTLLNLILERRKANKLLTLRLTTAVVLVAAVALTLALVSHLVAADFVRAAFRRLRAAGGLATAVGAWITATHLWIFACLETGGNVIIGQKACRY